MGDMRPASRDPNRDIAQDTTVGIDRSEDSLPPGIILKSSPWKESEGSPIWPVEIKDLLKLQGVALYGANDMGF